MNKIINYDNLRSFAYSNDKLIKGGIKGIAIDFFGLGCQNMFNDNDTREGISFANEGIIYLIPYANPWGWMNKDEISLSDEIIDVIIQQYNLDDNVKIVSMGGSMGGLCSLVYSYYAKRTPIACVSNCPVCDLPYHFTERVDLPRTLYSAFFNEEGNIKEVLKRYSPLHLAPKMPNIKYTLFHCTNDLAVNKEMHTDRFVQAMTDKDITYYKVEGRGHCDLGEEMYKKYLNAVAVFISTKELIL